LLVSLRRSCRFPAPQQVSCRALRHCCLKRLPRARLPACSRFTCLLPAYCLLPFYLGCCRTPLDCLRSAVSACVSPRYLAPLPFLLPACLFCVLLSFRFSVSFCYASASTQIMPASACTASAVWCCHTLLRTCLPAFCCVLGFTCRSFLRYRSLHCLCLRCTRAPAVRITADYRLPLHLPLRYLRIREEANGRGGRD